MLMVQALLTDRVHVEFYFATSLWLLHGLTSSSISIVAATETTHPVLGRKTCMFKTKI